MGIAFLTKREVLLRRESAQAGNRWQMADVRHTNVRLVGLYASLSASTQDWKDINAALNASVPKKEALLSADISMRATCRGSLLEKRGEAMHCRL